MKKSIKKTLGLFAAVTLAFGLTACSSSTTANNKSKELKKIKVTEPVHSELWGPFYLASELGFYKEQGLDVEFVTVQGDMPTAPVIAGEAQFGLYGPEMILSFNSKGQGTKLLATASDRYPYSLVAKKGIKSVKDLKGATINAGDSGSSPRQFIKAVLTSAGLDPEKDVKFVNVPGSASISALENGQIDATYVSPTARTLALQQGYELLIDIYDNAKHKELIQSDSYEMYIAFSTDKYIKENPETVQAFINASYKAMLWAESHTTDEIIAVLKPSFPNSKTLETAIKEIKDNNIWSSTGDFSESGYAAINTMSKKAGMITADVPRENVINDTFIKSAQKNIKLDKK